MLRTVSAASRLEPAIAAQSATMDTLMTSLVRLNASPAQRAHLPSKYSPIYKFSYF